MQLPQCSWQSPTYPLALPNGVVHLWKLNLNEPDTPLGRFLEWLSTEELERAENYSYEDSRQDFILSRTALRYLIGQYLGCPPGEIQFTYNPYGKPDIDLPEGGRRLKFNLAHSGRFAVLAFAWDSRVGVDIELLSRRVDLEIMIPRVLSPEERDIFQSIPLDQQKLAYLSAWTQKEAYLKAIGSGLTRSLDQISVNILLGKAGLLKDDRSVGVLRSDKKSSQSGGGWHLCNFEVQPGLVGTLAVEGDSCQLAYYTLLLNAEHL